MSKLFMICFDFWDERERNTSVILDETKNFLFVLNKGNINNEYRRRRRRRRCIVQQKNCTLKG